MLWMLAALYNHLPEVGDIDKPKLVVFFDEAHLVGGWTRCSLTSKRDCEACNAALR